MNFQLLASDSDDDLPDYLIEGLNSQSSPNGLQFDCTSKECLEFSRIPADAKLTCPSDTKARKRKDDATAVVNQAENLLSRHKKVHNNSNKNAIMDDISLLNGPYKELSRGKVISMWSNYPFESYCNARRTPEECPHPSLRSSLKGGAPPEKDVKKNVRKASQSIIGFKKSRSRSSHLSPSPHRSIGALTEGVLTPAENATRRVLEQLWEEPKADFRRSPFFDFSPTSVFENVSEVSSFGNHIESENYPAGNANNQSDPTARVLFEEDDLSLTSNAVETVVEIQIEKKERKSIEWKRSSYPQLF